MKELKEAEAKTKSEATKANAGTQFECSRH
jgi:hypothetical protein